MSELETATLVVHTQLKGDAWWGFTDLVVTDAETALGTIESTLESRQPPRCRAGSPPCPAAPSST